jgi:hypothetical protein
MNPSLNKTSHALATAITIALLFGTPTSAQAQVGVSSSGVVGATALTGFIAGLGSNSSSTSAPISATANHTFAGVDSQGNPQTMLFTGSVTAQSDFGRLHVYSTASVSNVYYSAANALFSDANGNIVNPNGSPGGLVSLGFATFDETFAFGGTALQNGYKARYIFHVDGTNTGTAALADLGVTVDANPDDLFFAGDTGTLSTNWVTSDFAINGVTPQNMHVQFSDQVNLFLPDLTEAGSYTGTSDFSGTLTLAAIEVVDPSGNLASGWTVSSGSGTVYSAIQAPEPTSLAFLMLGSVAALLRQRSRHAR